MAGRAHVKAGARVEDAALLTGRGRFGDDLPVRADTLHAAILRSPHAHAEIVAIDVSAAVAIPGVACVVTGEDALRWTQPFTVAIKAAVEHRCLATDRVRYVGEPVAGLWRATATPPRTRSSRSRSSIARCRR
jgi:2-furoyl-CoA dehydrogenase large subunit